MNDPKKQEKWWKCLFEIGVGILNLSQMHMRSAKRKKKWPVKVND